MEKKLFPNLKEALAYLKGHPDETVAALAESMVVEIHKTRKATADDIFEAVGPWQGETAEEIMAIINDPTPHTPPPLEEAPPRR